MENTSSTKTSSLPPISLLFTDSWQVFIHSILSLFILNIVGIAIYVGLGIIAVLLLILSGAGSLLLKNGLQGLATNLPNILSSFLIPFAVISVVFMLVSIIIGMVLNISSILLVDSQGQGSIGSIFKRSFSLIIPLLLVNILVYILCFGAFFVLVLPVILFGYLLTFTQFEVILNNQRWLQALKRSVAIVSKNFGAILIRWLIITLIYIAIVVIIPSLLNKIGSEMQIIVGVFSFIVNLMLGWYMLAYQITLYKQAKAIVGSEEVKGIAWMWVVSMVGWLIAIAIFFLGYKVASSGFLKNLIPQSSINQNLDPTSAGSLVKDANSKIQQVMQLQNKGSLTEVENQQKISLISEALSEYKRATERDPSNIDAWQNLAVINQKLGQVFGNSQSSDQIVFYNEAARAYYNLGKVYLQQGLKDLAKEAFQKGLEVVPVSNNALRSNIEQALKSI